MRAAFSNFSSVDACSISRFISRSSRIFLPSRNNISRRMSRRYSSRLIRRLQGAVHWLMLCKRHGRNQRQRSSPSAMSSEQVRKRKIFCSTLIAARSFFALVKGP